MARHFSRKCSLGAAALVTLLSSCGTDLRKFNGLSATPAPDGRAIAAARMLSACPTSVAPLTSIKPVNVQSVDITNTERSALAAAAVGIGVDAALTAIQIGLEQAESRLNGNFLAMGAQVGGPETVQASSGTARQNSGCLVIYQGLGDASKVSPPGAGLDPSVIAALGLSDQPAFYIELAATVHGTTRVLRVNHLQYAATSALRRGSGRKTVTLAVGLGAIGKTAEDPKAAAEVFLFNLGQLEVGNSYPGTSGQIAVAPLKAQGTFNIAALVTESENPSIALEAMTSAFAANKASLASALKDISK